MTHATRSRFFTPTLVLAIALAACSDSQELNTPPDPDPGPSDFLTYEGSETCRTCHQAIYASWDKTRHNKIVVAASLANVVNDVDGNGVNDFVQGGAAITFDVGTSAPAGRSEFQDFALGTGVEYPKLGYDGANLLVRIGANTYTVSFVIDGQTGRGNQRYLVTIDNQEYLTPIQYNPVERSYATLDLENWYKQNGAGDTLTGFVYAAGQTPITQGNVDTSWQKRFLGRHVMGARDIAKNTAGEYGGTIDSMLAAGKFHELAIGCEACHGPAARHVDLGGGIGTALNPATLAADRANEVCGQCHSRGSSTNTEQLGYGWATGSLVDNGFRPGDELAQFHAAVSRDDDEFFWQNGARSAKLSRQQQTEHGHSAHGRAGITCLTCHAPHGSNQPANLKLPVNTLCLSCHDGEGDIDANDLRKHTRHFADDANLCSSCHFPRTAKSGHEFDVRAHTYKVIFPAESETTPDLPNTCAECHSGTPSQLTSLLRARWPDVSPVAYAHASPRSSGPSFSPDQLIAPNSASAIFVPTAAGTYTFLLTVINEDGRRSRPAVLTLDATEGVDQNLPDLRQSRYMGSTRCSICHSDVHDDWLGTRHGRSLKPAAQAVIFADSDEDGVNDWVQGGAGLTFNLRTSPNSDRTDWDELSFSGGVDAPRIGFLSSSNTYRVAIGANTYDVSFAIGGTGKWSQRYLVTSDEGEYALPLQWNDAAGIWGIVDLELWYGQTGTTVDSHVYDAGDTPVTEGRADDSFQFRCLTCHATGARDMSKNSATGEYALSLNRMLAAGSGPRIAELGTGCESCHGPGSQHMTPGTGGDGSPSIRGAIINPSKLSSERANEACAQCHSTGTSTNSADFHFPWRASAVNGHYIPGQVLADHFGFTDETDDTAFWTDPSGHSRLKYQQWLDARWSRHVKSAGITCAKCHSSHTDEIGGQLRRPTNQLCLNCHQDITVDEGAVLNHSRHANASTANQCNTCHMVVVGRSAVDFDLHAHSFELIYPRTSTEVLQSSSDGVAIPNSCTTAGCHSQAEGSVPAWDENDESDNAQSTGEITRMWGDLRPFSVPRVDSNGLRRTAHFTAPVTVQLDGTRSYDPNDTPITGYNWTLVGAPAGSSAVLLNRQTSRPSIPIAAPGEYTFALIVRDGNRASKSRTVSVSLE